jgi:antibiotic biosynthesis monooxygenase (ABM) superfamily enzyme
MSNMDSPASGRVSIITQTRVRAEQNDEFARWQVETSKIVAAFPGFIEQTVMPPSPPQQVDWVILQRFASEAQAVAWLNSQERLKRVQGIQPMLVGSDDVHIVKDGAAGALPAPVALVISTRIKPGQEADYRRWEQKIAVAQAKARGFQGYRFEPPIPGVQEDWLSILRFDTEEHLKAWIDSPERQALLADAAAFTEEVHTRIARTGFDQWFPSSSEGSPPPSPWKMNMIVLVLLYPIVLLFGNFFVNPYLLAWARLPFPVALFISNVVSIVILNYLVPWTAARFSWWLQPKGNDTGSTDIKGYLLLAAACAVMVVVFTLYA